ncbi:E3 ubiquitin-protein ligase ubr-1 [Dirofilaria immitis]|nr:E3 ubiquitin-protein ligase ubr-1 [Dirofilaria immitis]
MQMIDKLISVTRASKWDEAERILVDYWTQQCPLICAPTKDPSFDFKIDENTLNEKLLHPIACAYCLDSNAGTDLTPLNASYGSKSSANRRSVFCGHVFRGGEATYSCKECACDPTCMWASSGNGYCDCGDVEAWKEHPACKLHEVQGHEEQDSHMTDVPTEITEQVETRIRSLTRIVLRFSTRIICWRDENILPTFLREKETDHILPLYQTMLLNDETHTFDSVIRALNLSIHCNQLQAMQLATMIDREGRASVRNGSIDYCIKAKDEIQRRTQRDSNHRTEKSGPLDVRVIDSRFISLQNFAVRLIGWLTNQTRHFPALALTMCEILLNEKIELEANDSTNEMDQTLMAHIMKRDSALWKGARLYKKIYDDFIDDDHDQSVSITALTVQIFTVPTIARMLIAEESAFKVVFDALINQCKKYLKTADKMRFDFSARSYPHSLRRALYMLCDQRYLLSVVPSEQEWTPLLRENFLSGCSSLLQFLSFMQGMNEVRRQTAEHQVWEQEWETAFNIQIKLQHILTLIICWANSDEIVHNRLMIQLISELETTASRSPDYANKIVIEVNGIKASSIPFDLSHGSLSVHQPLWRLLAEEACTSDGNAITVIIHLSICIIITMVKFGDSYKLSFVSKNSELKQGFRTLLSVTSANVAKKWIFIGKSGSHSIIHNYAAPTCRAEMFDRDILMLQVCAAITPPDTFIIRVLHRFGLRVWAESNFEEIRAAFSNVASDDLSKCTITLAEEMLHLFIIIIGERYMPGVGKSTMKALLRREVLHVLATKPTPFSKIERAIPVNQLFAELSVEEAAKSVGDFRKPTKTSPGIFLLKDNVRSEYNTFFYHYSKTDVSNADQYRQKFTSKALKKEVAVAAPPMPPQFEPFYAPIINLLCSKMMMQLLRVVFERTAKEVAIQALFLVGMGLNEQIINKDFDFISSAEKGSVLTVMRSLVGKPESEPHADLLEYLLELYEKTKSESKGTVIRPEPKTEASESEMKAKKQLLLLKNGNKQWIRILPQNSGFPICLGIDRSVAKCDYCRRITCILCQEDEDVTTHGQALVCAAFMQKSSLFARLKQEERLQRFAQSIYFGFTSKWSFSFNLWSCNAFQFSELLKDRDRGRNRQLMAFNPRVLDVNSGEYLCPLCKRLSNAILPVLPPLAQIFADRSHSERSLMELASREVENGNTLSASACCVTVFVEMKNPQFIEPDEIMEVDDNEESQSGADGRFFAILTTIPDVMHKIKDMLIQSEKQQNDSVRTHFSPAIWDMMNYFLNQTYSHLENDGTSGYFNREIMEAIFTFQTAAFSLRSIAVTLRRAGKPLFGAWNARQRECIYALSRSCAAVTMKCSSSYYYLRLLLLQLLSPLLSQRTTTDQNPASDSTTESKNLINHSSPKTLESQLEFAVVVLITEDIKKPVNILTIDMLSLAIEMAMCEGWEYMNKNGKVMNKEGVAMFPHGSENEQYAIRLTLIGHLYQVIVSFDVEPIISKQPASPFAMPEDKALDDLLLHLYTIARPGQQLLSMTALKRNVNFLIGAREYIKNSYIYITLHTAVLEFLRPLSLLYHALTLVPPPEALKDNIKKMNFCFFDPSVNEFEPLCRYLGFTPSLGEFLGGSSVEKLFALWTSSQGDKSKIDFVRQPVLENAFVQLPEDFSELINYAANFRCPSISSDDRSSSAPSLCLLCGSLLCSQSYCCQRTVNGITLGACSYHLKACTGSSGGVFLRIRDSQIVLLTTRERGCLFPAPYVDVYGETDPGFRRGNPLHLSHELYAKLENIWLNQSIAEEVANQYEIDHRNIGLEWHHF